MPTEVAVIVGVIVVVFATFAVTLAWVDWHSSRPTGQRQDNPAGRPQIQHRNETLKA